MNSSLKNILALILIFSGTLYMGTTLNKYIAYNEDEKAKTIIINTIALECREVEKQNKMPASFYSSASVIDKMLGSGVNNLSENTYIRLVSLCYGQAKISEKIKL